MTPRADAAGATIARVDHHQFLEKYHVAKGVAGVVIAVHYSARGAITSMRKETGDDDLYGQLFTDE